MNSNDLTFEQTKKILDKFIKEDTKLKYDIEKEDDEIPYLIDNMVKSIDYALENQEKPYWEETLDEREIGKVVYFNYLLPSYYLSDKYENLNDFLDAYILLLNNYTLIYKEKLTEKFINSTQALNSLMKIENHFMRLLEISELLIAKYEKGFKLREEPFTISKTYLKELLEEANNIKAED